MKALDKVKQTAVKEIFKKSFKIGRWFIAIFLIASLSYYLAENNERAEETLTTSLGCVQFFLIVIPLLFLAIKYLIILSEKIFTKKNVNFIGKHIVEITLIIITLCALKIAF